jgi:hypothetical protein
MSWSVRVSSLFPCMSVMVPLLLFPYAILLTACFPNQPPAHTNADFTRLKLVQAMKQNEIEEEMKRKEAARSSALKSGKSIGKENDADITARFDAQDDEDVVF